MRHASSWSGISALSMIVGAGTALGLASISAAQSVQIQKRVRTTDDGPRVEVRVQTDDDAPANGERRVEVRKRVRADRAGDAGEGCCCGDGCSCCSGAKGHADHGDDGEGHNVIRQFRIQRGGGQNGQPKIIVGHGDDGDNDGPAVVRQFRVERGGDEGGHPHVFVGGGHGGAMGFGPAAGNFGPAAGGFGVASGGFGGAVARVHPDVKISGKIIIVGPDGKSQTFNLDGEPEGGAKHAAPHVKVFRSDDDDDTGAGGGPRIRLNHLSPGGPVQGQIIIVGPDGKERSFEFGDRPELQVRRLELPKQQQLELMPRQLRLNLQPLEIQRQHLKVLDGDGHELHLQLHGGGPGDDGDNHPQRAGGGWVM